MKKLILALSLGFVFIGNIHANESMRNCMLLPVTDGVDNAVGFKVFEQVEEYLKDVDWCSYKSNSALIDILGQYSKNLELHLGNKDVLRVIGEKTKAGSLIKISLSLVADSTKVVVEVFSDNGDDRYFKEQTQLSTQDVGVITQTVRNWLDIYEKNIPYNARVRGVLGDQFTIDIGKKARLVNGMEITIERPTAKRQHPLLKEIIDYDSEKIATARIIDVSEHQAQARVIQYEGTKKLKIDDWVKTRTQDNKRSGVEKIPYTQVAEEKTPGHLGSAGILLSLGSGKMEASGANNRKADGFKIGADLKAELWATRHWWAGLDFSKNFGKYENGESDSGNNTEIRLKFGYKFLPMGFFYGPQVDVYAGYGRYVYGLSTDVARKLTEFSFSGLLIGARANIPLIEKYRGYLGLDLLLTNSYEEKVRVYGKDDSSQTFRIEFGILHNYTSNINLVAGAQVLNAKAELPNNIEKQFSDLSVKVGAIFTF